MSLPRSTSNLGICILLFGFTAAIGGCGGPMLFAKPGAGEAELKNDSYDCDQEWSRSGPGQAYARDPLGSLGYLAMAGSDKQACMERKGWTKTDGGAQPKKSDAVTEQSQPREQPKAEASTLRLKFGIVPAEVTPTIANLLKMDEVGGVFVAAVYADSVASRAGIKKNDVILKYGDKILSTDPNQLKAAVEATSPASVAPITIWRNGSQIALSAQF